MSLVARIAWRYLRMKKSHGAVSAVAAVAVTGVAVATAAIVCVLSVFNGFRDLLVEQNDKILPDIEVTATNNRLIQNGDSLAGVIAAVRGVAVSSPVVADQALAIYNAQETPVILRGVVPEDFRRITSVDSLIVAGSTIPDDDLSKDTAEGLISVGVAYRIKAYEPGNKLFIFAPRRRGRINPANPLTSFFTDSIAVAGILESRQQEIDQNSIYVPIDLARALFQYDTQATTIAVKGGPGTDPAALSERISEKIGPDYEVKDRAHQQAMNFRMVEIEKWVTSLLLIFILVIASFNIISTMTMFVLEKRRSIRTLRAIGMNRNAIGNIFGMESLYITLIGTLSGIALGVALCMLQQHFGFIHIGGDTEAMMVRAYPVKVEAMDILIVLAPMILIGLATAVTAASFARSRISEKRQ